MPTSSACTIKSLASCGNPSFSARDLALFCADTAGGLPRMKRSRKSESETVFIFIKRPEQLHVRIMTILPTKIEDSYRIRCFLYEASASEAEHRRWCAEEASVIILPTHPWVRVTGVRLRRSVDHRD